MTIGLFHAPDPRAAGIVQLESTNRVIEFVEKPAHPRGDLASAGVFLARQSLFDVMPQSRAEVFDFGLHVLPHLVGAMYGHVIEDFLMDIGTSAALARAADQWRQLAAPGAPA
jgi:NDP-sugar pyrophosphorylase family protein